MTLNLGSLGDLIWAQLWQVTVVVLLVAVFTRLGCRGRPHLAHLLWLVVLVKCWIPPLWSSPTGVFSWSQFSQSPAPGHPTHRRPPPVKTADRGRARSVNATPGREPFDMATSNNDEMPVSSDSLAYSSSSPLGWFLFTTWLGGAAFVTGLAAVHGQRWRKKICAGAVAVPAEVASLVSDLVAKLRSRHAPRIVVTPLPVGPAVYGVLRPTLVLPEFVVAGRSRDQLAVILAHELVHVRRGDLPWGLFQLLTQAAWWFHPLVWWAGRELARERERSCDEEVVAGLRCEPADYAQNLVDVLKARRLHGLPAWVGIRPVEITRRRLEHIMSRGGSACAGTPWRYRFVAGLVLLAVAPGAELRSAELLAAQDDRREPPASISALKAETEEQAGAPLTGAKNEPPAADDNRSDEKAIDQKEENNERTAIRRAVARGVAYLKAEQNHDGTWPDPAGYPGGITALCSFALLESGVSADDDAMQRSLSQLRQFKPNTTYVAALTVMVFCAAEPKRDEKHIQRFVDWLADHQKQAGAMTGAWGYPQADGDNSNTGFALAALYDADRVGVHAEEDVWRRALHYWTSTQSSNGSWGYKPATPGTGSMTSQGLTCVAAACKVLGEHKPESPGPLAISRASQWLGSNFSVTVSPGSHGQGWQLYYLHALSRAGRLTAQQKLGDHDWYAEGARSLVDSQVVPGGYWKGTGHAENDPHIATSLALLFLSGESHLGD